MNEQPKHPLRGLLVAQFFGAFNDNAWKLAVTFLALRAVTQQFGESGEAFEAASQTKTTIVFSALTITLMFRVVSLPMIEKRMLAHRPAFAAHAATTSLVIPWPPRSSAQGS